METQGLDVVAGVISTILFASSNIPMLVKAFRTKDLRSYSFKHIAMVNIGNGVHWIYIAGLPFGPIWFLHGFYTIASAILLLWYLRYERWEREPAKTSGKFTIKDKEQEAEHAVCQHEHDDLRDAAGDLRRAGG